jgi:hypothetical protein
MAEARRRRRRYRCLVARPVASDSGVKDPDLDEAALDEAALAVDAIASVAEKAAAAADDPTALARGHTWSDVDLDAGSAATAR